jgi:hypothetical protein
MSLESDLIQRVIAMGTLAGAKVYDRQVPQGVQTPFVALTKISGNTPTTLDGRALLSRATVRVAIFGRSATDEQSIAAVVRATFNGFRGFIGATRVNSLRVEDAAAEVALSDGDNVVKGTGLDLFFLYQET